MGIGTNIYGVLFVVVALVIGIFMIAYLKNMWQRYIRDVKSAFEANKEIPSWLSEAVLTILVVGSFVVILTLGWNVMQRAMVNMSTYKSPAEISEQKKVFGSETPSREEMDKVRSKQRQQTDVKPQDDAFDAFNEKMRIEADKIRNRSLQEHTP